VASGDLWDGVVFWNEFCRTFSLGRLPQNKMEGKEVKGVADRGVESVRWEQRAERRCSRDLDSQHDSAHFGEPAGGEFPLSPWDPQTPFGCLSLCLFSVLLFIPLLGLVHPPDFLKNLYLTIWNSLRLKIFFQVDETSSKKLKVKTSDMTGLILINTVMSLSLNFEFQTLTYLAMLALAPR